MIDVIICIIISFATDRDENTEGIRRTGRKGEWKCVERQ